MKKFIKRRPYLIPVFIILGAGALAFFSWAVMSLWNAVLVPAAGAGIITFWQGLGLLVLSRILIGGGKRWRHRGMWRGRCESLSPEEKQQFKEFWRKRWHGTEPEQQPAQ